MTTILARIAELERAITEIARAHPHAPRLAAMEWAITDLHIFAEPVPATGKQGLWEWQP